MEVRLTPRPPPTRSPQASCGLPSRVRQPLALVLSLRIPGSRMSAVALDPELWPRPHALFPAFTSVSVVPFVNEPAPALDCLTGMQNFFGPY